MKIIFKIIVELLGIDKEYRLKERQEIAHMIIENSYWFSEHKPSYLLLYNLGIKIKELGWFEPSMLRDVWRDDIKKELEQKEELEYSKLYKYLYNEVRINPGMLSRNNGEVMYKKFTESVLKFYNKNF